MHAPLMSDICKSYVRSVVRGDLRSAFQYLSQVDDKELFRGIAVPAIEDIDDLFDQEPGPPPAFSDDIPGVAAVMGNGPRAAALSAAAMGGQVLNRISQMIYGYHVVKNRKQNYEKGAAAPDTNTDTWAKDYVHHCVSLQELPLEINDDLTDSLPAPLPNPPALTDADFTNAAATLRTDVPAVRAVAQVESAGSGFGPTGLPVIRYELHRFQSKTHRHFHKTHPHLSQPSLSAGGKYHNGSQVREYTMLYNAMLLELKGTRTITEAIESTSWGKFQVMGENWSSLGWASALAFASDMYASEANQLDAFVRFVQHKGLSTALRTHNWAAFALGYNGPNFAVNNYDTNMANAFQRFSRAAAGARP